MFRRQFGFRHLKLWQELMLVAAAALLAAAITYMVQSERGRTCYDDVGRGSILGPCGFEYTPSGSGGGAPGLLTPPVELAPELAQHLSDIPSGFNLVHVND